MIKSMRFFFSKKFYNVMLGSSEHFCILFLHVKKESAYEK